MTIEELCKSLNRKAGLETVSNSSTPNQIRLIGRVPTQGISTWLSIMERLLIRSESTKWKVDLSKQYFIRGGKLMYGWRIIFQSPEPIEEHLADIEGIISNTPAPIGESDEFHLYGNVNRTVLKRGKGAQGVLNPVVGPMALQMAKMGG